MRSTAIAVEGVAGKIRLLSWGCSFYMAITGIILTALSRRKCILGTQLCFYNIKENPAVIDGIHMFLLCNLPPPPSFWKSASGSLNL